MLVVLNQVDRLGDGEAETCRTDLRRLLRRRRARARPGA